MGIFEHAHGNYRYAVVLQISKFEKKYNNIIISAISSSVQLNLVFHYHSASCGTLFYDNLLLYNTLITNQKGFRS